MLYRSQSIRAGIKLAELMIAVFIILILTGLFIVWSYQSREHLAGPRATTSNHLRQLGLALINQESATQSFPQGYNSATGKSFYYEIRREIEAETFCAKDGTAARPFNCFLCPTRRMVSKLNKEVAPADFGYAVSSPGVNTILGGNARVGALRLKDGAANTMLLTLISVRPEHYRGTDGVDSPWPMTNYGREIRPFVRDTDPDAGPGRMGAPYERVFPCAFAEGSIRMIHYDVDVNVIRALWSYDGGESVDPSAFNP